MEEAVRMARVRGKIAYKQNSASETKEAMCYFKVCKMERIPTIHIPNEGQRSKAAGGILKAMGLTSGTPDFFHFVMRGGFGGLWVEMKRNKKYTPSEMKKPSWLDQISMIKKLREQGYMAEFAFGWEHAKKIRDYYLSLSPITTANFSIKCEPLGVEFQHVLNKNLWEIYEN